MQHDVTVTWQSITQRSLHDLNKKNMQNPKQCLTMSGLIVGINQVFFILSFIEIHKKMINYSLIVT